MQSVRKPDIAADQLALLRLNLTPGLGRVTLLKLLEYYASPAAIVEHSCAHWRQQAKISAPRFETLLPENDPMVLRAGTYIEQNKIRLVAITDPAYPQELRQISDPPALLYVRGDFSSRPCIAIVGSRRATRDGKRMAKELGAGLVRAGFCVVSGLASGIDGAAHEGALSVPRLDNADSPDGNVAMGVLGGGIDVVYPRSNAQLYEAISACGALISEYPPGCEPMAHHFPGRNRIISALSLGVIVVEAAERSGSLITADFALEHGRDVFAVPGSVYSPASGGTLQLLKDGATMVTSVQDVIDAYAQYPQRSSAMTFPSTAVLTPQQRSLFESPTLASEHESGIWAATSQLDTLLSGLNSTEQKVYTLLSSDPLHLDEIAGECGLTPMNVSSIVLHLELQGCVTALPGGRYIRA
ncbi:MAG: DNA-processing protein DprA [Desulfuromonadaceae bacterium]|nr:DNA-processing protein DprA [Desulfuromonadaceae bacterium]